MNKFTRGISANGNDSLKTRGELIGKQAKMEQENLIRELESKKTDLELKVDRMTDLAPDSTVSTKPSGQAVDNPKLWVRELHQAKKEIKLLDIEITIAKETLTEWFTEPTEQVK